MLSEPVILRCIASCLETSEFYVGKGIRTAADWWHNRADAYADRLAACRQIDALKVRRQMAESPERISTAQRSSPTQD